MKKCNCKQKLSDKKITLSTNSGQELCVGDIVLYEAGTAYDGKWKVMTIDSWGRVLLMSTKNVAKVELSGYTGYLKCIEELNGVCEPLGRGYGAVGARCVNENDIIEFTNGYKFYTKITSEMLFNKNRSASYWLANTSEITSEHVQSVTVSCICAGQKNYKTLYRIILFSFF